MLLIVRSLGLFSSCYLNTAVLNWAAKCIQRGSTHYELLEYFSIKLHVQEDKRYINLSSCHTWPRSTTERQNISAQNVQGFTFFSLFTSNI